MIGQTFLMEFKTGWKGFIIFIFLVLLVAGGMPQLFPVFQESLTQEYEGAENLKLTLPDEPGGEINLSWEPVENALLYSVIETNHTFIIPYTRIFTINSTSINITYDFDEIRFYVVFAVINLTTDPVPIGMTSTEGSGEDLWKEILDNPGYAGFTGGRDINFNELNGFLSIELFGWWWMLVGLFIAYISVATVANDFTEKRMDLIFSTPLSRERYIIEKFLAMGALSFVILLFAAGALAGGANSIGLSNELDGNMAFQAFIGCLPFLLVIAAVGILTAVFFRNTVVGMGMTFMFILMEFIFFTLAGLSKDFEGLKYLSIMEYWDYHSVLFDGTFNVGYFIGLFVAAFVILGLAIYVFKKRDIPA